MDSGGTTGDHPHERAWVRLPLTGAHNVRELGGYPTRSGDATAYHRFLRADSLFALTARDRRFLHDYGVRMVIDLRGASEASLMPDVKMPDDVEYANVPLLDFNVAGTTKTRRRAREGYHMGHLYRRMLQSREPVRTCMQTIAFAPDGCVLFHCAVGKDRTGILAMLLLALAGVSRGDVVSNYVQSWPNLMEDESFASDYHDPRRARTRHFMESRPEYIEFAYDFIMDEWGGVESYLRACGVSASELERVRRRLV